MNDHQYTDLQIIEFELEITGKKAEILLYNFRKEMQKSGKTLQDCIADYKKVIKDEDEIERLRYRASKTLKIVYKTFLFLVVSGLIYLSFEKSEYLTLLEGNELTVIGLILMGMIVGAIVGSFWESDHSVFVNGTFGIIGSLIGILYTNHAFDTLERNLFFYILSILIAVTLLLFVYNFIVSLGGIILTSVIALVFGLSNLNLLKEIFSDNFILVSVVVTSLLFALLHQKILKNNYTRFIYLFLTSLIGGIFGVVVLSDKLRLFETSDISNRVIFSLVGSIIVVLFTEFVDRQAENVY